MTGFFGSLFNSFFTLAPGQRQASSQPPVCSNARTRPIAMANARPLFAPDINALIVFSDVPIVLSGFARLTDAGFAQAVRSLPGRVGGLTYMGAGLDKAIDLFKSAPEGMRRKITLLTDGIANDRDAVLRAAARAAAARINLDTIGIGKPGDYDGDLLSIISGMTYRGRMYHCGNVASLDRAFGHGRPRSVSHVGQATVFVVDASGSMATDFGRQPRIEAVRHAIERLVRVKQKQWS